MRNLPDGASWLRDRPIAHRGRFDNVAVPENSAASCCRCVDEGIPIELDVQLSRNGVPMVVHDVHLGRLCGVDATVASLDLRQLQKLRLLGTPEPIPTLAEILHLVNGQVPILVELKATTASNGLEAATWRALAPYAGPYAVQSFEPWSLVRFRHLAPHVPRGQLVSDDFGDRPGHSRLQRLALHAMLLNRLTQPHFIAVDVHTLSPRYARFVKARTSCVLGWTIRTPADWQTCATQGFNAIYEDRQ